MSIFFCFLPLIYCLLSIIYFIRLRIIEDFMLTLQP
jgi:hypothetical protein